MLSLTAAITTIILFISWIRSQALKRSKLPPGPPPWPIIGNLLDMPTSFEWFQYKEWGKKYQADMIYLNIMGTTVIVVNTLEVVQDLFEKRSSIYSSRVQLSMLNELMGWGWTLALLPYGDSWRTHRRLFYDAFDPRASRKHHSQIVRGVNDLLRRFLNTPELWNAHLQHQAGRTIMDIAYGIDVLPENDPYIRAAEKGIAVMVANQASAFLVDAIPVLKYLPSWLPGAGFKRFSLESRRLSHEVLESPFRVLKQAVADGVARPSFGSRCLENIDALGNIEHQEWVIKNTAASMYGAGADTNFAAAATFILAMVKYPDVQAKAQAELDSVIGRETFPTFNDEGSLPYLHAVIKECMRWLTIAPMALPHVLTADDEYKGFKFPAGSIVIANSWAILHDERTYPDPFRFQPERYLKDGKSDTSVQDPELAVFGYGRRICPGRHMARASLWLTAASILTAFDISKAVRPDGTCIEPSAAHTSFFVSHPEPFDCKIVPRSEEMAKLIMDTAQGVSEE